MKETIKNLTKAFIGKSQAINRYTYYAKVAKKEGYEQISGIFIETAEQEKTHAKRLFKHIQELKKEINENMEHITVEAEALTEYGTTEKNLKAAIAGENCEHSDMYPSFATKAEEEGLTHVAAILKSIAKTEEHHKQRYEKLLSQIQSEKIISIIGLGYMGLPLALLTNRKGHKVIGIDVDSEKAKLLNNRISPFAEQEIAEQLKNSSLEATTDVSRIKDTSVIIICVPTPVYKNHTPNLEPVKNACDNIAPFIQKDQLVILESTVNPSVCENIVLPILEKESGLKCGKDFYLAHCPERIQPGNKKWNVENTPRVVGSFDKIGLQKAIEFYQSIISGEVKPMSSLKEAEATKIVENTFIDINIAFVNELAMSFSRLGIDVANVIDGAATKPFGFMTYFPGCGVGGHCIPIDPYYLIEHAKKNGFEHDFLALARRINDKMPKFTAGIAAKGLNEKKIAINGARVAVLGLSYKPEIDDCRESSSFEIIKSLKDYGAEVISYDPFILEKSTTKSLDEAIKGAEAIIIATAHKVFKELTPDYFLKNGVKVVIDGRNCLPKEKFIEAGIVYKGIGR